MVNIASLLHVLGLVYASTHVLSVSALTTPELRSRSIYQIFTDRFARHDALTPYCDTSQRSYCGGTWKGIEGRLDYIQGMGFDTGEPFDALVLVTGPDIRLDSLDLSGSSKLRS